MEAQTSSLHNQPKTQQRTIKTEPENRANEEEEEEEEGQGWSNIKKNQMQQSWTFEPNNHKIQQN